MTPEELKQFLRDLDRDQPMESGLDKWRREAREQEERFARERRKSRNLTDSEMQRWRDYFHDLVARERAAMTELVQSERQFQLEVLTQALAEIQLDIEEQNERALEKALAGLQVSINALREEIDKRAAIDAGAVVDLPNSLLQRGRA